jgi:hypothetical protein
VRSGAVRVVAALAAVSGLSVERARRSMIDLAGRIVLGVVRNLPGVAVGMRLRLVRTVTVRVSLRRLPMEAVGVAGRLRGVV